ncbi:MAG: stage III sporulation protein AD [Clostridiales bacterium]
MEALQLVMLGITATMLALFVRERNKEFGLLVSLAGGILLITLILEPLSTVIMGVRDLAQRGQVSLAYIDIVLKATAIAFLTEFAAQICQDAGEGALAKKVEAGGKVLILLIALPIFSSVLDGLLALLP